MGWLKYLWVVLLTWVTSIPTLIFSHQNSANDSKSETLASSLVCESANVITGAYCEVQSDAILGSFQPLALRRMYQEDRGWSFNHPGLMMPADLAIIEETAKEKNVYQYDESQRLISMETAEMDGHQRMQVAYQSLDEKEQRHLCDIHLSDGRSLQYNFELSEERNRSGKTLLIHQMVNAEGGWIKYHYRKHPSERRYLVERRESSSGQYLITEYYDSVPEKGKDPLRDLTLGKVKLQMAPLGVDETPIVQNRFFYQEGFTEVRDAHHCKILYRYSKERLLTAVEHYTLADRLYRKECLFWKKGENHPPRLLTKALLDGEGQVMRSRSYQYDEQGRKIKETLYGNLTGNCGQKLLLQENGQPIENGIERYSTTYRYSDVKGSELLLEQKEDNGQAILYRYQPETELIASKFVCQEGKVCIRYFYSYDPNGRLVHLLIDDGSSFDAQNLQGASEQRITLYTFNQWGQEGLEEYLVELNSFQKKLLKKTTNHYSSCGSLVAQETRLGESNDENPQIESSCHYDLFGRVIKSVDVSGATITYSYDAFGHKISETVTTPSGQSKCMQFHYDLAERLVRSDEIIPDGSVMSTTYRYDYMGNKVACIDSFGNETRYQYDEFGRLVATIQPAVLNKEDLLFYPTEKNVYDVCDYPLERIDAKGDKTRMRYNARGKPIEIFHPDGTTEKFHYALDGSLIKSISRNGAVASYSRDFLSRITHAEIFSRSGVLLSATSATYNAFHMTSSESGQESILYDAEGRKKSVLTLAGKQTEYEYDAAGQQIRRKEWLKSDPSDYLVYYIERDARNELVEARVEDSSGQVLKRMGREEKPVAADVDKITHDFYNDRGQNVPQKIAVDSNGNSTVAIFDAIGRIEAVIKRDWLGQELSRREMRYDGMGNKVREVHVSPTSQPYVVEWSYGAEKRLEVVIEGVGSSLERRTEYLYDNFGQLITIKKPDGVLLHHHYDDLGQLLSYCSSDRSISYQYSYDLLGNMTKIEDQVQGTLSLRTYNATNQVVQETLANGLTIELEYDEKGRRTALSLPDSSKIAYVYDQRVLRAIERISEKGEQIYSHSYTEYTPSGELLRAQMIGDIGEIALKRNENGRLTEIRSPYYSEEIGEEGVNAFGQLTKNRIETALGGVSHDYAYDQANQVIGEEGEFSYAYAYDARGNCVQKNGHDFVIDALNQLTETPHERYVYDANGRRLLKILNDKVTHWEYDALDRLIRVTTEEERGVAFTYDAYHRRMTKQALEWDSVNQSWTKGAIERYLYEGNNEIGSVSPEGKIAQLRVLGTGLGAELGAAVAIELEGEVFAPLHDRRGSVCALVSFKSGQVVEYYAFSAFGECLIRDASGEVLKESEVDNPWRFLSKRFDCETSLSYFGKRYYDAQIGRWLTPDPLGFVDGLNRYTFVQNNPINQLDLYGLYSFSDFWQDVQGFFSNAYEAIQSTVNYMQQASYHTYIREDLERVGNIVIGKQYLILLGCYRDSGESGVYGEGEAGEKIRVTAINGMMNIRYDCIASLKLISSTHQNVNVHYVFRPTVGWTWDMIMGGMVKAGYTSPQARELAKLWKNLIKDMGGTEGGGLIIHYAHSIGGADTAIAKHLLTPEEQKMIRIITTGSATLIDSGGFESVVNYVSYRDGVPMFIDPINYIKALMGQNDTVMFIGTKKGIPLIDHFLSSGAYYDLFMMLGKQFSAMYPPK